MRLNPESLKVETFTTSGEIADRVAPASSDTRPMECSGLCVAPTCIYEFCG